MRSPEQRILLPDLVTVLEEHLTIDFLGIASDVASDADKEMLRKSTDWTVDNIEYIENPLLGILEVKSNFGETKGTWIKIDEIYPSADFVIADENAKSQLTPQRSIFSITTENKRFIVYYLEDQRVSMMRDKLWFLSTRLESETDNDKRKEFLEKRQRKIDRVKQSIFDFIKK